MIYDPSIHHRRSIRLKNYDYSIEGAYFITICTYNRQCIFGKITGIGGTCNIVLNDYGKIAKNEWQKTQQIRDNIWLGEFIIMPNHLHGIIHIINNKNISITGENGEFHMMPNSIGSIIGQYKSVVTKNIRKLGCIDFKWQRNYYENIIRSEKDYENIKNYIINNPMIWVCDKYHNE